ncbi:hypothetical protein SynBIOSU31_00342 [Synechococcus sp. BIOS-U3-1]|nr:hypothetical protein SynBIOSU31_00342 [Synechococcus sp. BIOS-U3-1]
MVKQWPENPQKVFQVISFGLRKSGKGRLAIRHTSLLTTTNVDVNRGFINLCCNLGGKESATSI